MNIEHLLRQGKNPTKQLFNLLKHR
jgi:hypothetical protein